MNNSAFIDEQKIRKTIATLIPQGKVFEVRIFGGERKGGISGYFKDADTMLKALNTVDLNHKNVYITLNYLNEACYSREQHNCFRYGVTATGDNDVKGYSWLFIDLDPVRTTGTSSTDEEMKKAFSLAKEVMNYLNSLGFEQPVRAVSGNGAHLLYKIQLENNQENRALVERCLKSLDILFSNDDVSVDTVNHNPSRICKLHGTLAQKGDNNPEDGRIHRMSRITFVPEEIKVTDKARLENLTKILPAQTQSPYPPARYEFDIETWMQAHGIQYSIKTWKDTTKFVLEECPFDSTHRAPDACIIRHASGAITFKCLHNSCKEKTWHDVRMKFEPEHFTSSERMDTTIEDGWRKHNHDKDLVYGVMNAMDPQPDMPVFLTMKQIRAKKEPENEYLQTGIDVIDTKMKGLQKGAISVLSGLRGAAKSTLLSQIMLNVINKGHRVICYSGELSSKNFSKWLFLQAAGNKHTVQSKKFPTFYTVPENIKDKISEWMEGKFWLYNNDYGNRFATIAQVLEKQIEEIKADFVVLDNLMALDLTGMKHIKRDDKYDLQTDFVWKLKEIAQNCNVHVLFVAHPRKAQGFLRLDDISGTGNIANIVDNAFIVHRNNNDFRKKTAEEYKWPMDHKAYSGTNVIEICKDRENGIQDEFIPLWYEQSTKRLLNGPGEYIPLDWEETTYDKEEPF